MPLEVTHAVAVEESALATLRNEWRELWAQCPRATPFQSPDWLLPWWRQFGNDTPWVLTLRWEERLIGLLPLFLWERSGKRVASLIGSGITDHLDALVPPGFEQMAAESWFAYLAQQTGRWDECDWQELPADSPLLCEPVAPDWRDEVTEQSSCPVLKFPATLPRHKRVNLRRYGGRVAALGAQIESVRSTDLAEALTALFELHSAQWQPGMFADEKVRAFHREVAAGMLANGMLRMYVMRAAGRIIGGCYGFQAHGRAHFYLMGSDPAWAKHSVGTLLVGHAIEAAQREGVGEFDFLRGREDYKYTWGAVDRGQYRRVLRHGKGPHD